MARWYFCKIYYNDTINLLANIINNEISLNKYSKHAKQQQQGQFSKRYDKTKIKIYRTVNLLKLFSKYTNHFCIKISQIT